MAVHVLRTGGHEARVAGFGDVVMIQIEAASRHAVRRGEGVQFIERAVADQMRPQPSMSGPAGVVDQDRHPSMLRLARDTHPVLLRMLPGIG